MVRIKYDATILNYISLFESLTGARVKDCIVDDNLLFIIKNGDMGLAIGRNGSSLKRVEDTLKKPIKIIEFDEDIVKFIRNYVFPLRKLEIEKEEKTVKIKGQDMKTKGLLIGRDRSNLKRMTVIVKRFFDVDNITVV